LKRNRSLHHVHHGLNGFYGLHNGLYGFHDLHKSLH
jgi:hypothetical protein